MSNIIAMPAPRRATGQFTLKIFQMHVHLLGTTTPKISAGCDPGRR